MLSRSTLLSMCLSGLLLPIASPASSFSVNCVCEHFGSQYDGICEAHPQGGTGPFTFEWNPWGSAYLPYPYDPTSGFAYYDIINRGCAGGLDVRVFDAHNQVWSAWRSCSFHTGGANC